jgi:superfamily I DNA and/or RNA helicase
VDKFQGQEAAVVLYSMCASSGDASLRGIEFLFSKNRLNVAISRAQTLVVGNRSLARTRCTWTDGTCERFLPRRRAFRRDQKILKIEPRESLH